MKLQMFAIYDTAAHAYISPFSMPTLEMAQRSFSEGANQPDHMFCKHPNDFRLYHIGMFDIEQGNLTSFPELVNLGHAVDYKIGGGK